MDNFEDKDRIAEEASSNAGSATLNKVKIPDTEPTPEPAYVLEESAPEVDLKSARRAYSRVGLSLLIMVLAYNVFGIALMLISEAVGTENTFGKVFYWISAIAPQYVLAMPLALLLLKSLPSAPIERKNLGVGKWLLIFVITLGMMMFGNLIGTAINSVITSITGVEQGGLVNDMLNSETLILNTLLVAILAPIFEELVFRKMIIDKLSVYGEKSAIFISSILFGLTHGNIEQFFYVFLIGMVFGYVYSKTKNVVYSILLHSAANLMGGIIPLIITSNIDLEKFESITDTAEMVTFITENILPFLGLIALTLIDYLALGASIVILICLARRIANSLSSKECIPAGKRFRTMAINAGMISFAVLSAISFILVMLP